MIDVRLAVLLVTYVGIAAPRIPGTRINRPVAALLGAVAMVTIGGLSMRAALGAIDLDVLVFLLGVFVLTGGLELGGFFEWAAVRIAARAHSPRMLLGGIVALSGLLSACFVNDTICLVLTPLVLAVVRPLRLRPLPFLLAVALASNVGSAMTPTGNPQNMLIGVTSGIGFGPFIAALALPACGGLVIVYVVLAVLYRRDLAMPLPDAPDRPAAELDRPLVVKSLVVFGLALAGWLAGLSLPLVAIACAAILIAIARRDPEAVFRTVEWPLLVFFAALFVLMRGVADVPLVQSLTAAVVARLHGQPWHDATAVSIAMTALSNLVSNVPAVILWLPVVPRLPQPDFIWLVMAMSATFAGNLTLVGSMANLIVAERAQARGEPMRFLEYLRAGVPVTVLTIAWGIVAMVLVR